MTLTIKQAMERIDQLQMKKDMIDAIQDWLRKNFTGETGVRGRTIPADVIDELLVDIDVALVAPTNDEIEQLEKMEVEGGKAKQRKDPKPKAKAKGKGKGRVRKGAGKKSV